MGSALKGLTSHDYCLIFGQRVYQEVFLNWLCQYLSFLDTFFNIFYSVEKCGATPHCWYRDSLTLITLKKSLTYNKVLNNTAKAGCHPSAYKIPRMDLFCKNCYSLFSQKKPQSQMFDLVLDALFFSDSIFCSTFEIVFDINNKSLLVHLGFIT